MENIEQKLDQILWFLKQNSGYVQYTGTEYKKLMQQLDINTSDLVEYCEILEDDDYILVNYTKSALQEQIVGSIKLKIKGIFFINQGGYVGKLEAFDKDNALERKNDKYLRYGAVGAAIGSILYLVWDIMKFSYDHPHFFCFGH